MAEDKKGLARALAVLRYLVDVAPEPVSVREVASTLGVPPSTVHRILNSLLEQGWVSRGPGSTYAIGLRLREVAWKLNDQVDLRDLARPVLERLVDAIDETARLVLYDHRRRRSMTALSVESRHPLRYLPPAGEWSGLRAGASSLAIIAFLDDAERNKVLARGLATATGGALSAEEARAECELVRQRGFAVSVGRRIVGLVGLAAPILDAAGVVLGAVAVGVPEVRHDPASNDAIGARLQVAANEIGTAASGGTPPPLAVGAK